MVDYGYGVSLDTIKIENLEDMRQERNNPETRKWCRQTGLIEEMNQSKWYDKIISDNSIKMFVIKDSETYDDYMCGVCGLTSIDYINRHAEFSILIDEVDRGNGWGTKALKTLIKFGFNELNLELIWGETFENNPGMKLYEKLGFVKEGTLRQRYYKNGEYLNSHVFSIRREEVKF